MPLEKTARFAKRSILLIVGNLIKLAVQLAVIYIYSRQLSLEDYGRYQSVWLYINLFSVIGLFGLPSVMLSSSTIDIKRWMKVNRKLVMRFLLCLTAGPILWILLLQQDLSLVERVLLCLLLLAQNLSILSETLSIKQEAEKRLLLVNIIYHTLYLFVHLWLIYIQTFNLSYLLYSLIGLLLMKALTLYRNDRMAGVGEGITYSTKLGKQWLYLGLYDTVAVLFKWMDKWIILLFISLNEFAIYFNGSYEIPVFMLLAGAIGNIVVVELAKSRLVDSAVALPLFKRSSLFMSALMLPAFCFLLFFYKELFLFVFSEKYAAALPVFFASIFIVPVRVMNYTAALQVFYKNDIILKGALIDLALAISLAAVLYPLLGLPGIALAFVLSSYIQGGFYLFHTSRLLQVPLYRLHPFKKMALVFLMSLLLTWACHLLVEDASGLYKLAAGLLSTTVLAGGFFLYFFKRKEI